MEEKKTVQPTVTKPEKFLKSKKKIIPVSFKECVNYGTKNYIGTEQNIRNERIHSKSQAVVKIKGFDIEDDSKNLNALPRQNNVSTSFKYILP